MATTGWLCILICVEIGSRTTWERRGQAAEDIPHLCRRDKLDVCRLRKPMSHEDSPPYVYTHQSVATVNEAARQIVATMNEAMVTNMFKVGRIRLCAYISICVLHGPVAGAAGAACTFSGPVPLSLSIPGRMRSADCALIMAHLVCMHIDCNLPRSKQQKQTANSQQPATTAVASAASSS